jgi:hypothetical protein
MDEGRGGEKNRREGRTKNQEQEARGEGAYPTSAIAIRVQTSDS